jgi:hypothetical protein
MPSQPWGELAWPVAGLQNGPDAVALVSSALEVVDFIAYEGVFEAAAGVAAGLTPQLLPRWQTPATEPGLSLQRSGLLDDWRWDLATATRGQLNPGLLLPEADVRRVPVAPVWSLVLLAVIGWWFVAGRRVAVLQRWRLWLASQP